MQVAATMLCLAATAASAQDDDRGVLQRLIEDNLSTEGRDVRIEGFKGALSSEATLDKLTIADEDGAWLTVKDVKLNWSRSALLLGRFEVTEFSAGEILVPRLPKPQEGVDVPDAEASGFSLPELPVSVNVDKIEARKVVLGAPLLGEEVSISLNGSLSLSGGEGSAKLDIARLDRTSDLIALEASYANEDRNLGIDLTVTEDAGGLASRLMGIPGEPSIRLTVTGDAPLADYTAKVALDTDGERRIDGTVNVQAPAPDPENPEAGAPLRFTADIGGDVTPVFAPDYRAFFGRDVALKLRGAKPADGGLSIEELSVKSAALVLDGTLDLSQDNWPERFDLTGRIASQDGSRVLLPSGGPKTTLDSMDLALRYDRSTGDEWRLSLGAAGLEREDLTLARVQLDGGGTLAKGEGTAPGRVDGALDFVAEGVAPTDQDLARALGDQLAGDIKFDWTEGDPFRLSALDLRGSDYSVSGTAALKGIGKPMDPRVTASVVLKAADLARFAGVAGADLEGAAELQVDASSVPMTGALEVDVTGTAQDLAVGQPRVDPLLRGTTKLTVAARRGKDGTFLDTLKVVSPATDLNASAALRSTGSTAQASLAVADASLIEPKLSGPAKLTLDAEQTGDIWSIRTAATGPGGANITGDGKVTLVEGNPGPFEVEASAAVGDLAPYSALAGRAVDGAADVALTASGDLATLSGQVDATVNGNDLAVGIDAADRILAGRSLIEVEAQRSAEGALTVSRAVIDTPRLDATAEGRLEADGSARATVDATGDNLAIGVAQADAILRGKSTLRANVERRADGSLVINEARLNSPQASASASGTVGTEGNAQATFDARLANLALFAPGIPGPATASGTIRGDGNGYVVDVDATGPAGIAASVAGRIGADGNLNLGVNGKAPLALANLFISPRSLNGVAQFDLRVNGPPQPSSVAGTITTRGAQLALPTLRLGLSGINANIRLAGGGAQIDILGNVSTGGQLAVSGRLGLDAPYRADLAVDLRNVGVADPGLYTTTADGRITFNGPATGGANIAGTINLGEVKVRIPNGAISSGANLPGLKHVNEPPQVRRTRAFADLLDKATQGGTSGAGSGGPVYGIDVLINAPSRIFIRGRGLDAEMGGRLRLRGTTAQIIPEGRFDLIRGRLDLLGKRLDLTEGYLQMQGSFVPFLRLVAETTSGDVRVIIIIEGPASEPDIVFSSQPELPEDQVLSQLIFGRDISQISAFQALKLASAVATLAGRGGDGVVGKLRKGFGLDDLDVTTGPNDETQVKAGKYLSENVYSEVEVDSEGQSQINLNLEINKNVKAKGSFGADGDSGLGIFFEKDY